MKIAICDDDQDELQNISSILDTYIKERNATELLANTEFNYVTLERVRSS